MRVSLPLGGPWTGGAPQGLGIRVVQGEGSAPPSDAQVPKGIGAAPVALDPGLERSSRKHGRTAGRALFLARAWNGREDGCRRVGCQSWGLKEAIEMEDIEQLARSWFDAWAARDFEKLIKLYAPDAEYVRADGYSKNGAGAIINYLKEVDVSFPDETATIQSILVSSDAATVEWTEDGTHTAPLKTETLTIEPTGEAITNQRVVDIFRFQDGKIASQHQYYDRLSMVRQFGWLDQLARPTTSG